MKVVKFGGSSLSSGEQLKKVYQIVTSDPERKIVVVSAPGKRSPEDTKVTDLLIQCGDSYLKNGHCGDEAEVLIERYASIARDLELPQHVMEEIRSNIKEVLESDRTDAEKYMDTVKASGEDNHAKLIAAYFNKMGSKATYVNPQDAGLYVSDEPGNAQVLPTSYESLLKLRDYEGIVIFPGFFGYTKEGKIATFSRSGSDITGSILANGTKAKVYENFTDVDAVYSVNPTIVNQPKEIKELTYREMRELSYAGFSVFHDEALIPAFRAGIPVNVKNTNNPSAPGTLIVNERENTNGPVIGIASDKGFCSIYISKYLMNRELGFGRKLLQILEEHGISYEHVPSGIDDITVIIRESQMNSKDEALIVERIYDELHADNVKVERNLAMLMIVGEGMRQNIGTTARASKALANAGVNIEMINQGSSEVSMMFGVKGSNEHKAVEALYNEFFVPVAAL
ncbi:aspartate kinase [Bacillus testis]|uniref:aspartate kinase n=1 Tax=Bacillus testis TaxID=1622072 RepID=UPI00067EDFCE|nr:aspartate kinase [Bacillus testis]